MPRIAWLTDLHLNFVEDEEREHFYATVRASRPDAVTISGDIAEAQTVVELLEELDLRLQKPIYFVLGNHDFYFGSIAGVRRAIERLCRRRSRLKYLRNCAKITFTN